VRLRSAETAEGAARLAAQEVAALCREAVRDRGRAVIALSGGETPWLMLRELRTLDVPWSWLYVAQVDERVAPRGDVRRNRTRIEEILVDGGPLPARQFLPMPVEENDLAGAAAGYQRLLELHAGTPVQLDLVQLGLGTDGHTASLVSGDPVLRVRDRDVAPTGEYQGQRRMTLTYPALARARRRLWLVTGAAKAAPLADLLADRGHAPSIAVARGDTLVVTDATALVDPATRPAR
jgi:6-phosphogluconolactonase